MIQKITIISFIFLTTFLKLHSSNTYDESLKEIIIDAVRNNKPEDVESLLKREANPDTVDRDSFTLLHLAIFKDSLEIVELLIKHGANLNLGDSCGDTPLHVASWNQHKDIVNLLIKAGANANALNDNGANPLHVEIYLNPNCTEIKEALLAAGSKLDNMKKYSVARTYHDETKTELRPEVITYPGSINAASIAVAGVAITSFAYSLKYVFIFCW